MTPPAEANATRSRSLILAALFFIVLANGAATQFVAQALDYRPGLGAPLFGQIYPPWAWLVWRAEFERDHPRPFRLASAGILAAVSAGMLGLFYGGGAGGRAARRYEGVHGTAHWASRAEIEDPGSCLAGKSWPRRLCRRLARQTRPASLSPAQRARAHRRHRADPKRQRRRPCRSDASLLAS